MKNIIAAAALLAIAGAAQAGTVSYSGSYALSSTNFFSAPIANVTQWDPAAFGASASDLISVKLTVTGKARGFVNAENLDVTPADVNYNVSASVIVSAPAGISLATIPVANGTQSLSAFDGTQDFGGTSGFSSGTMNASSAPLSQTVLAAFAAYIGTGNVAGVTITGIGSSGGSGGGNLIFQAGTDAGADWTIEYTWIPTPGAAALLGLGGLVAGRRRR